MKTGHKNKIKDTKKIDAYEKCVCCRRQTEISVEQEIELRPFYIEGAGQLCYDCYQNLYKTKRGAI